MKQTHVLTAVCAFVSVLTSAQVAVAEGVQGMSPVQQQAMLLELNHASQPEPPAEWRADRYLSMPSLACNEARAQASAEPAIPAEWRADRYLSTSSMAGAGGQEAQAQADTTPMVPAEWRADRYLSTPSMADAGGHGMRNQEMSAGSC